MKIKPSLFIFLGDLTNDLATNFTMYIGQEESVKRVIAGLHIDSSGHVRVTAPENGQSNLSFGFISGTDYKSNYDKICDVEQELQAQISKIIDELQDVNKQNELFKSGHTADESTQITIITPVYDSVGSVILMPLLGVLNKISKQLTTALTINILGIFPDFKKEEKTKEELLRTYALFCEIEHEYNASLTALGQHLFSKFYILSNRNQNNRVLSDKDFGSIIPVIAEFCWYLICLQTGNVENEIIDEVSQKRNLFNSFGISCIHYPSSQLFERKIALGLYELLNDSVKQVDEKKISKDVVSGEVKTFLANWQYDKLYEQLENTSDTKEKIYSPFSSFVSVYKTQDKPIDENIFAEIEKSKEDYDLELQKRSISAQVQRVRDLKTDLVKGFEEYPTILSDKPYPSLLAHLHAFYSGMIRKESPYSTGENLNVQNDLLEFEQKEMSFFKQFLGKEDQQLETDLKKLNADINNKKAFIDRLNGDIFTQFKLLDKSAYLNLITQSPESDPLFVNRNEDNPVKDYVPSKFSADQLPQMIDLRKFMPPVENQESLSSCTANALAGAYEYILSRVKNLKEDVSRLFIYYNSRAITGNEIEDKGANLYDCVEALKKYGVCDEKTWPYVQSKVDTKPSKVAYDEGRKLLIDFAESIKISVFDMKHCLAEGFPFVFGLQIPESFDTTKKVFNQTEQGNLSKSAIMSHAMVCVGYSEKDQVFIVRNSWGKNWGENGYCYIPFSYMGNPNLCHDCLIIRHTATQFDYSTDLVQEETVSLFQQMVAKTSIDELRKSKAQAEAELISLQNEFLSKDRDYQRILNQFKDPSVRLNAGNIKVEEIKTLNGKNKEDLTSKFAAIKEQKIKIDQIIEEKDRKMKWMVMLIPLIALASFSIVFLFLWWMGIVSITSAISFIIENPIFSIVMALIIILGYTAFVIMKYLGLKNRFENEQSVLLNLQNNERTQVKSLIERESEIFDVKNNIMLHSRILQLISDLKDWNLGRIESIELLINTLRENKQSCLDLLRKTIQAQSIFADSLVDLDNEINQDDLRKFSVKFYDSNDGVPFITFYKDYCQSKSMELFHQKTKAYFEDYFKDSKELDVVTYIGKNLLKNEEEFEKHIKILINSSAVFLNFVPNTDLKFESFLFCPGSESNTDRQKIVSSISNKLPNLNTQNSLTRDNKDFITLFRVSSNFPAYKASFLAEAANLFLKEESQELRDQSFIVPELSDKYSMMPVDKFYSDQSMIAMIITACALGIIEFNSKKHAYIIEKETFKSLYALYDHFQLLKYKTKYDDLCAKVNAFRKKFINQSEKEKERIEKQVKDILASIDIFHDTYFNQLEQRLLREFTV